MTGALLAACVPSDGRPKAKQDAGRVAALRPTAVRSAERPRPRLEAGVARTSADPGRPAAAAATLVPPTRPPSDTAPAAQPFQDDFERQEIGPDWRPTSAVWRLDQGRLCARSARNHPIWLKHKLGRNARIEFDAVSASTDGDIKVELWGDGRSYATGVSYVNATSYILIFGGWKNQLHVLARLDEHGRDRAEVKVDHAGASLKALPVEAERAYHFKVERADGLTIRWMVDDIEILSLTDQKPLAGPGHEHLGFNDWEVPVCFDNIMITPLAD